MKPVRNRHSLRNVIVLDATTFQPLCARGTAMHKKGLEYCLSKTLPCNTKCIVLYWHFKRLHSGCFQTDSSGNLCFQVAVRL